MEENTPLTCYVHPDRQTVLRCNRCERPICTSCAILTPTGYRCRECVRGQQKVFNTTKTLDYILAPLVAGLLSYAGSQVVRFFGFFTLLAAPLVGMIIVEAVKRVTANRRSRQLFTLTTAAVVLGGLPMLALTLMRLLYAASAGAFNVLGVLPLAYQLGYMLLVVGSVRYRLTGISL